MEETWKGFIFGIVKGNPAKAAESGLVCVWRRVDGGSGGCSRGEGSRRVREGKKGQYGALEQGDIDQK